MRMKLQGRFTLLLLFTTLAQVWGSSVRNWVLGNGPAAYLSADTPLPAKVRYHSPVKAAWFSAVCPGLGQMYNKKWWKLPIVYGALGGALYFLLYSQNEYVKARDSYRALVLPQPNPYQVHPDYQGYGPYEIKSFRDYFRQNRDYAILASAGVYVLQILDATVDAHLLTFDVSDKLSLRLIPNFRIQGFGFSAVLDWR
ncbi:MAG: DUF5683 domain-containing protein [Flavobacteriales bacterium]|nr:DUF5683 domain-containing protein [Flavobacteriales bacterium]MDW8410810.1 DUF5683 domain-containing protein [Flavobacteriales bacterium]